MKRARLALAAAAALLAPLAQATQCTPDAVPAATLLVPHFKVDLGACATPEQRATTIVWVRNTAMSHRLVQVTLWGDVGKAVVGFPIYLPPLAARHIDLGEVICNGRVPSTGAGVSPISDFGAGDAPNFAGCNGTADPDGGLPVNGQFPVSLIADVQARLLGFRSFVNGQCSGFPYGDDVARGYATIDVVQACDVLLPDQAAYHASVIGFDNVLVGGYEFRDPSQNFAEGGAAVGIEAADPGVYAANDVTFYGRYLGFSAADRREPLPANWSLPVRTEGTLGQNGFAVVWREVPPTSSTGSCFAPPAPMPLPDGGQVVFDADGQSGGEPVVFPGQPEPADVPIALATQFMSLSELDAYTPFAAEVGHGSARLDLQYTSNVGNPPGPYGQSWVGTLRHLEGRFSDFTPATALDSSCSAGKAVPANTAGPTAANLESRVYIFSNGIEP